MLLAGVIRRWAQACVAIAGTVAAFVLLVWTVGDWRLAAWGANLVPMAPATAWTILLLSSGVLLVQRWPSRASVQGMGYLVVGIAMAMGLWVSLSVLFDWESAVEGWLACSTDRVGDIRVGRMSPLTAAGIMVAALIFALQLPPWNRHWMCRQTAAVLALATAMIGVIAMLSYLLGMPVLYGTRVIPMAFPAAVSLTALTFGFLLNAGTDTFPLLLFQTSGDAAASPPRSWTVGGPVLTFLFLSGGIGTVGYCYFRHQVALSRQAAESELSAIADLKVHQILDWREERMGNSQAIMHEPFAGVYFRQFLADPAQKRHRSRLLAWIDQIRKHNQGLQVLLLDADLNVRLAALEEQAFLGPVARTFIVQALQSNQVVMSDLHRSHLSGRVHLDLVIPIRGSPLPSEDEVTPGDPELSPPIGAIVIEIDPHRSLYPCIKTWPTLSRTGETLLVRREGEEAVFLNDLRHQPNTSLSLKRPIDMLSLPAARAVSGYEGVVEGFDYRSVPVLAVTRTVPGTAWSLVAKVDQAEIYTPLRARGLATGAFVLGFVLVAALSVGLMARYRDLRWLRNQFALQRERQLILDSTDEGVLGLDLEGRHVFVNPAACRMLGYELAELIGQASHALWHYRLPDGTPYPEEQCPIRGVLRTGIPHRSDQEVFWRKDGTSFPVEYAATPSGDTDRPLAVILFFRDISQRKQSQVLLEQTKEAAETANRAKSQFLANMSHEIRTPLTAILGYLDLILDDDLGTTTREHALVIKRNGEHLLEIISDVLDLSKIEAGKMETQQSRCSPFDLLAEVVSLMRVRAEAKHLRLEWEIVALLPETILTDPLRVRQVLMNLVGNAIKFTDQGEVRIVARLLSDSPTPRLRFDVIDTGIGIVESQITRLFRPFSQLDDSSTRKFGGTGLGLAISKRLAGLLGGDIIAHSSPERGSTFSLTIDPGPLENIRMLSRADHEAVPALPAAPARTETSPSLQARILLAEDGLDNQRLIKLLLTKAGAEVTVVENGQLALDAVAVRSAFNAPFDVILMDIQMPVMDGYTAVRTLRSRGYQGPIIALTAHAMADDRQSCLDAGCDDYVTKPVDRCQLIAVITRWMTAPANS